MARRFSKSLLWIVVGCCILYVLLPLGITFPRLASACRPRVASPFYSDRWKAATFESGVRFPMANELIRTKALLGLSEGRLMEMLGEPHYRTVGQGQHGSVLYVYELAGQSQYPAVCWLYPWVCPNISSWALVIECRNGVVVKVWITQT